MALSNKKLAQKRNKANARKKAKANTNMNKSPRANNVTGMNVAFPRTMGDKLAFCKMLNAFRDEYFKGQSPYDITPMHLDILGAEEGIHRNMFYWNDELIAISETGAGVTHGMPTLGIATVYVKPSWRGKGIASSIYSFVENQLMKNIPNCMFYLQIEENELVANRQKFLNLGFTHAYVIPEFANGQEYKQTTYAVTKGAHIDDSIPLNSFCDADIWEVA